MVSIVDVECQKKCPAMVKASIPKGDGEIGKRVSRIIFKVSGKFIQLGSGK